MTANIALKRIRAFDRNSPIIMCGNLSVASWTLPIEKERKGFLLSKVEISKQSGVDYDERFKHGRKVRK